MEKVRSGIPGLDETIEGGFPKGSFLSIWGFDGYAETILAEQFVYYGAKNNEKCLYVATTETEYIVKRSMEEFGWNVEPYIDKSLKILEIPSQMFNDLNAVSRFLLKEVEKLGGVDRLGIVVTPLVHLSPPSYTLLSTRVWRERLWQYESVGMAIYTKGGIPPSLEVAARTIYDGIIDLVPSDVEKYDGYLRVSKLHRTKFTHKYMPFKIEREKGIVLV